MIALARTALAAAALLVAAQAHSQVTFYEHDNFNGRSFETSRQIRNFERAGFSDRASSVIVTGLLWEVCEDRGFEGRCMVLRPGRYPSLQSIGLNDRISSVRTIERSARIDDSRYAPLPAVTYDYRQRRGERLFEAPVISARAVVGEPERRCWMEQEEVASDRRSANVPAAVAGALIGGILGHQIGGGSGRDIATAGGVIGGAVVGSNVGRNDRGQPVMQNVQRCTTRSPDRPSYWDVTYRFRGQEHRVQMTEPPGESITVNRQGEPRAS